MVSHADTFAIENSGLNNDTCLNSALYLFDLRSYLHDSWLDDSQVKRVLFKERNTSALSQTGHLESYRRADSFVWNKLYGSLCKELSIQATPVKNRNDQHSIYDDFLQKFIDSPFVPLAFVGACLRIDTHFLLSEGDDSNDSLGDFEKYPLGDVVKLNLPLKKSAFHAKQSFALDRRFHDFCMGDDVLTGLSLLYKFLSIEDCSLWERIRLIYRKPQVSCVEAYVKSIDVTDANYRTLKRLWGFVDNLIFESSKVNQVR